MRNKKIKSATLVETLVALTIIMLSFGFALLIFSQVISTGKVSRQTRAYLSINDLRMKNDPDTVSVEGIKFNRNIVPYSQDTSLRILTIEALSGNGEMVFSHREIILTDTTN